MCEIWSDKVEEEEEEGGKEQVTYGVGQSLEKLVAVSQPCQRTGRHVVGVCDQRTFEQDTGQKREASSSHPVHLASHLAAFLWISSRPTTLSPLQHCADCGLFL